MSTYLGALQAELEMIDLPSGTALDTVYLGGGTPSLLPAESFRRLAEAIDRRFPIHEGSEMTVEANPEDISSELVNTWVDAGVTRISMGVQSFDDAELGALDRRHDAATATAAARKVLERPGIQLNLDLMLGIPHQDAGSLRKSLDHLLDLRPSHVSVYILEMDKPHRLQALRRRFPERFADEELTASLYLEVHETLTRRGYEHYEVSNFALPGARARHNLRYWKGWPVHAIGAGAHGSSGARRWANLQSIPAYMEAVAQGTRPLAWATVLSRREHLAEQLLMGLRLREGIASELAAAGRRAFPDFSRRLDEFVELGLAMEGAGRCTLNPRGWLLSNELFVTLV